MTRYSIQPTDQIFVKGDGFWSFTKSMGKNIGKKVINTAKNFLIVLKSLQEMHLKLLQLKSFKKQQKQLVI